MRAQSLLPLLAALFLAGMSPLSATSEIASLPEETWEALYVGDEKVGHAHNTVRSVEENGIALIHTRVETTVAIKRFSEILEIKMDENTFESPDGKLARMDNRTFASHEETRVRGEVVGAEMKLCVSTAGKETIYAIPWKEDILGPYAQERLLRKENPPPGQKQNFQTFVPDLNKIATVTLEFGDKEETALLDGPRKLRRVCAGLDLLPDVKTMMWLDDKGQTLKTFTDMMGGLISYFTTREVALAQPGPLTKDVGISTLIKVEKAIPDPYAAVEVVYRLRADGRKLEELIPQDARQRLAKESDGSVLLTVRAAERKSPDNDIRPADGIFLRANNYLQSDNPKIQKTATEVTAEEQDPWKKAQRLQDWVFHHMTNKNFSVGFATAGEVIESLQGDCTEHSVLLAAMARAAGIPSRVAVGLVYIERHAAFGCHMWTEVHIDGQWLGLDGTSRQGLVGGTHIKIGDSSLDGADAMAAFLPVFQVVDKLKIEVVSWKH